MITKEQFIERLNNTFSHANLTFKETGGSIDVSIENEYVNSNTFISLNDEFYKHINEFIDRQGIEGEAHWNNTRTTFWIARKDGSVVWYGE